ncbi:MAG: hypothetical protein A2593_04915 [Candidatus Moranbacteria bacterium RIFOXYD1_FULL_44_9]|nr:MAG: hypothetical protein A2593_04915 [Candidatus Moranbacteria bacterium RIFOXYD1_FULL_44_9]
MGKKFDIDQPKKFEISNPKKFEINPESPIEKDIQAGLANIRNLGPQKPMGYLPIDTLKSYYRSSPEKEIELAKQNGYKYLIAEYAPIGFQGALYIFDEKSLQDVLDANKEILLKYDWPTNADSFVSQVSQGWFLDNAEILALIQKAFGDYRG